jgi:ribosomal-protein-alanine N-acetyltransferase
MTDEFRSARLALRRFDADASADQAFIVELLNQASFIDGIADRGVRTLQDAAAYLRDGPAASFARHGFGLMAIERLADREPIGMCGLLQREYLPHADIGYALLDRHAGQGYAREAAAATLDWGWRVHRLPRIVASTAPHNADSIRLLLQLGFRDAGRIRLPVHDGESCYLEIDAPAS